MQTTLFKWADENGLNMAQLGERLGYSERHMYRIKTGETLITEGFVAQVVYRLGEWARDLFLATVSESTDNLAETNDVPEAEEHGS